MTQQNERPGDGVFGFVARTTGTVAQAGLTVTTLPLVLLPAESRRHVRNAIAELALGVVATSRSIGLAAENVVDDIFSEAETPATNGSSLSERARSFASRLATAADDINQGLGTLARRAGDAVERSAADLDAWTQGRPAPSKPAAETVKAVDDWIEKKAD